MEVEYGKCHCGCGGDAPIAKQNEKATGRVKGKPQKFIVGHATSKKFKIVATGESRICACGCGKPTKLAKYTNKRWGTIKGIYAKYLQGHYKRPKRDEEMFFWSKVDIIVDNDCWEWKGYKDKQGYGHGVFHGKLQSAHRIAFLLSGGALTEEKNCVCHTCDFPACCNPAHLWAGSNADNNWDKIHKHRGG